MHDFDLSTEYLVLSTSSRRYATPDTRSLAARFVGCGPSPLSFLQRSSLSVSPLRSSSALSHSRRLKLNSSMPPAPRNSRTPGDSWPSGSGTKPSKRSAACRRLSRALVKVDLLRQVAGFERYVTAAQFCQWRLAALAGEAPEALTHYRRLIDALAEKWFHDGEKNNDQRLLRASGRTSLRQSFWRRRTAEVGRSGVWSRRLFGCRCYWQQISGGSDGFHGRGRTASCHGRRPALAVRWRNFDFARRGDELLPLVPSVSPPPFGIYPDSDIDPAAIHARLVLVSLFEGSRERASIELGLLKLLHPTSEGMIAGRHGRYVDELHALD